MRVSIFIKPSGRRIRSAAATLAASILVVSSFSGCASQMTRELPANRIVIPTADGSASQQSCDEDPACTSSRSKKPGALSMFGNLGGG